MKKWTVDIFLGILLLVIPAGTSLGSEYAHLGWKIEIPFNYRFLKHWSLEITPWYEYYSLGKSDPFIVTYAGIPAFAAYEPESRTNQAGVRLGVKVHF